jgi:GrpB-like predicted nucleotidyltransferase (UPF0157 family)
MQKRIIEVVDYDPQWAEAYRTESAAIQHALKDLDVRIHHIGSTSVPGLMAKPVIDILIEATDVAVLDCYDEAMRAIGYIPKGEFGITGRRFYLKGLYDRTHHIHAFNRGTPDVIRHLAFRDYLIAHPDIAIEYGVLKAEMADMCNNDNDTYCDGKADFVKKQEIKALAWQACQQGGQPDAFGAGYL